MRDHNKTVGESSHGSSMDSRPQHFINLFGGLEWLQFHEPVRNNIHFVRIQSTACEQKRWDFIIRDLDHTLLVYLSQGYPCTIYDMSRKNLESRALYQGLTFIRFVIEYYWFGCKPPRLNVRGQDSTEYFYSQLHALSPEAVNKLKTYQKILTTKEIFLTSRCLLSNHTDDYVTLRNILEKENKE
jgi:hypothetical protein